MTTTIVHLSPEEAKLFLLFREHQTRFEYLIEKGILDWKNGSITIHYKPTGQIQSVHYHQVDNESELSPC